MQIYYGWRIVAVAAILYMLVFGATVASFSLYVVPVSTEFGLSRAEMNTAFALVNVGSALWAPLIGRSLDRLPLKRIIALSAALMGPGFVILSLSHWLWLDALALGTGIAVGLDGAAMLTLTVLVARWFRARRARAMTLSVMGQALGVVTVPILTALLISSFGWRAALFVTGIVLALVLTLVAIFMRDHPEPGELEPDGDPSIQSPANWVGEGSVPPSRVVDFLRMPHFWLIAIGIAFTFTISTTFGISIVPLGISFGLSTTQAALMTSAYAVAAIVAKLFLAGFADRVPRLTLITALLAVGVPLFAAFPTIRSADWLIVYVILLGFAVGGFAALLPVLQADVFGLTSYGTVRGLMIPIQSASIAIGAFAAGKAYDLTRNYTWMFMGFAATQAIVIALFQLSRLARERHTRSLSCSAIAH